MTKGNLEEIRELINATLCDINAVLEYGSLTLDEEEEALKLSQGRLRVMFDRVTVDIDALKTVRKLAEIALCDVKDTLEYEYDIEEVLIETLESARDKFREILKYACEALEEE